MSSRNVPEKGCGAAAVHFCVVPEQHAEPSVNQNCLSSFISQSKGTPQEIIDIGLERDGHRLGLGTIDIWSLSHVNYCDFNV